jgi:hypothetical protein
MTVGKFLVIQTRQSRIIGLITKISAETRRMAASKQITRSVS